MSSKLLKLSLIATSLVLASGCVIHNGKHINKRADLYLEEELRLSADQLQALEIESGAGDVSIIGVDAQTDIKVMAKILTTDHRDYELSLKTRGDRAVLVADHDSQFGFHYGDSPRIDLTITMPKHLMIELDDGSGSIDIRNVNNKINIDDGSGELSLLNIQGDVTIEDGSGDLSVSNVKGNLDIDDGSGEVEVENVYGNVAITDGSGDLSVLDTQGVVTIDDGSGDIQIISAEALRILDDGSGDLSVNKIRNGVDIDS